MLDGNCRQERPVTSGSSGFFSPCAALCSRMKVLALLGHRALCWSREPPGATGPQSETEAEESRWLAFISVTVAPHLLVLCLPGLQRRRMRVGSGTRGWQERLLCGLHLCRDLLTGEGRASLLSWVLFWCPRWVPLEGGRTWGAVGGPPGQEQPWSETLPQGDERSPRAVLPQHTAPRPGPVWTRLLHFSKVEHLWKIRKRCQLCRCYPAESGERAGCGQGSMHLHFLLQSHLCVAE